MLKQLNVYGIRPVLELLNSDKEIDTIFLQKDIKSNWCDEIIKHSKEHGIGLKLVPKHKLNRLTKKNHQGVIAITAHIIYQNFEKHGENLSLRYSKYEGIDTVQNFIGKVKWVWVDTYEDFDLDSKTEDSSLKENSYEDLKNNRLMPQSPIGLHEWMISIDLALARRLRDLSHSINTELLKSGLVNTLVPINILDAVLAGQLSSSKSISNILTLKLPTNSSLGSGGIDIDCLLITPSDMEFDNPRLRKNRSHIKHYHNVVLSMIKQQRYWQGRSIAQEVNKEWWKDTTKI